MQTDWIGEWFRVFEELGENVDILCGQLPDGATQPRWSRFSHVRVDGLGALQEVLEQAGAAPQPLPTYPGKLPLWPVRAAAFVRYLRTRPPLAPSERPRLDRSGPPAGVAWALVSADATKRFQRHARAAKVNSNLFSLWGLNQAVTSLGLSSNQIPAWLVPVNLRGAVRLENPRANHSSFLTVSIADGSPPRAIADGLRGRLRDGAHFGAWMAMNLGKVIGLEKYRARTRGLLALPFGWTGSFSNLGTWRPAQLGLPPQVRGGWLGCPPASRKVPIACGCICVDGRLGIGLQLHPSLAEGDEAPRQLLERFVQVLLPGERPAEVATLGFTPWSEVLTSAPVGAPASTSARQA